MSPDDMALRAAASTARIPSVPTLNELYRPFRVGNVITEANPTLKPENLDGLETSATWHAASNLSTTATFFLARIDNAVGNVTIQTTPGLNVASRCSAMWYRRAGSLQQRQNIDRVRSEGAELEVTWTVTSTLDLTARYLYTDPKITRNAAVPALVDRLQLPRSRQSSGHVRGVMGTPCRYGLQPSGHAASGQFDDDQNTRHLKEVRNGATFMREQALNAAGRAFH